jgi:hypothetical protein
MLSGSREAHRRRERRDALGKKQKNAFALSRKVSKRIPPTLRQLKYLNHGSTSITILVLLNCLN